jgi:polysaccharide pyruvyl transferase WcaK-like protein
MMQRRDFLSTVATATGALAGGSLFAAAAKPKNILLSNGWHCVNIGDIAHAPGMIRLIETHLPGTTVTLWPKRELTPEVIAMLRAAFPQLEILPSGGVDDDNRVVGAELKTAIERADLFVLGSGGYHSEPIDTWRSLTDKPYGAYGVSLNTATHHEALNAAQFVYLRDTKALHVLQQAGVKPRVMEFAPDSTFGLHLRNDAAGDAYLRSVGLEHKKFLAVIPRSRYSPYDTIYGTPPTPRDVERRRVNAEFDLADHEPLRETMIRWVRETKLPVLACPEMTYHIELAKRVLVDPLPDDVKRKVVWRDSWWLCDEAASVLSSASALVSYDCHAPIIALVNGTPAIHVRLPSDTPKSQMFLDLGFTDWKQELDDVRGSKLADLTLAIEADPVAAGKKVKAGMAEAHRLQTRSMSVLRQILAG